jgi:hypothetical protein
MCTSCRKQPEDRTWWEKFRAWIMHWFHEELLDYGNERYTHGFGEGYEQGFNHAKERGQELNEIAQIISDIKQSFQAKLKLDTGIQAEDVITGMANEKGETVKLRLGSDELTDEAVRNLKNEVEILKRMQLWSIMQNTVKKLAIDKGINQSTDFEQVLSGKMMLHNLGIIKSILDSIDGFKLAPTKIITPDVKLK